MCISFGIFGCSRFLGRGTFGPRLEDRSAHHVTLFVVPGCVGKFRIDSFLRSCCLHSCSRVGNVCVAFDGSGIHSSFRCDCIRAPRIQMVDVCLRCICGFGNRTLHIFRGFRNCRLRFCLSLMPDVGRGYLRGFWSRTGKAEQACFAR